MAEQTSYMCDGCNKVIDGDGTRYMLQCGPVIIALKPGTVQSPLPMPQGQKHFHDAVCLEKWAAEEAGNNAKFMADVAARKAAQEARQKENPQSS